MFYVYLLENDRGRHYVGSTDNLKRRFKEHNTGQSKATQPYRPWKLLFYEAYSNEADAARREKYLKTTQGRQALHRMLRSHFTEATRLNLL